MKAEAHAEAVHVATIPADNVHAKGLQRLHGAKTVAHRDVLLDVSKRLLPSMPNCMFRTKSVFERLQWGIATGHNPMADVSSSWSSTGYNPMVRDLSSDSKK